MVTDKMVGIAMEAYDQQSGYSKIEKMRCALEAALSTETASAAAVKALEWRVPKDDGPRDPCIDDISLCADGIGGVYGISRKQTVGPERLLWWTDDPFTWTGYSSIDEAKAAAQADYEARIRSALA